MQARVASKKTTVFQPASLLQFPARLINLHFKLAYSKMNVTSFSWDMDNNL